MIQRNKKCCLKTKKLIYEELDLCEECLKYLMGLEEDGVVVTRDKNEFIITIESVSNQNPLWILIDAIDILSNKFKDL